MAAPGVNPSLRRRRHRRNRHLRHRRNLRHRRLDRRVQALLLPGSPGPWSPLQVPAALSARCKLQVPAPGLP